MPLLMRYDLGLMNPIKRVHAIALTSRLFETISLYQHTRTTSDSSTDGAT